MGFPGLKMADGWQEDPMRRQDNPGRKILPLLAQNIKNRQILPATTTFLRFLHFFNATKYFVGLKKHSGKATKH
jgi:hypothetical protein